MAEPIKTFVAAVPSGNSILTVDGIAYEGKLWLVPEWLESPSEQLRKPARMVRFDDHEHQALGPDGMWAYVVTRQVPQAVLDGHTTEGFETLSGDQITFGLRYSREHLS